MDTATRTTMNGTTMNGADIIVDFLLKQKVPYLFGVCGHGNVGFLDGRVQGAESYSHDIDAS